MLEDVLSTLYQSLHHGSSTHWQMKACLLAHGGERLFLSLLQKEEQSLRLLGLQLLTAFQGPQEANAAKSSQQGTQISATFLCVPCCGLFRISKSVKANVPFHEDEDNQTELRMTVSIKEFSMRKTESDP